MQDAPVDAPILGFDTSGGWCTAAVIRGDAVLAQRHVAMTRGQAEALMPLIEDVLAEAGVDLTELAAIGVGIGPGNFTGIRISVSAARGLALALGIPAIGIDRFEALALEAAETLPLVVPALRGQVWVKPAGAASDTAPELHDTPPSPAISDGEGAGNIPPAHPLPVAIARLAGARRATPQPRPAPLYLREPDAAPSSQQPPQMLA
ncbi:tRNA (adenosine(37)-N6)-threonylcarbamoyltransferase complex dimerization subunit type 1 TsaB [Pararhodobacter oceanensis]|uniref:tRNA (adenosine(37)-N6)-threonylcarbamoyltransferase complex dimerization subunit type 1 TsaB n=1 Tax=Pararhodobacter oceanensis TaxID=2172121 RepID=UPI003A949759